MGSIMKRGKPNNEYYVIRFEGPRNPDGTRNQKMESCRGMSYRQAKLRLAERELEVKNNTFIDPSSVLFADYLDGWLVTIEKTLSPHTLAIYRVLANTTMKGKLGGLKLSQMKPLHIQRFVDALQDDYKPNSINFIYRILHKALQDAVNLGLMGRNPATNIILPKGSHRSMKQYTKEQISAILSAAEAKDCHLLISVALETGMRVGEIRGLQFGDLKDNCIDVQRSISDTGGNIIIKSTKSGKSRMVAITPRLAEMIEQERLRQILEGVNNPNGWVFPGSGNNPVTSNWISYRVERIADMTGIRITMHMLRHNQATMLIVAGVPAKIVAERLGHASTQITEEIYTHIATDDQQQAIHAIQDQFGDLYS